MALSEKLAQEAHSTIHQINTDNFVGLYYAYISTAVLEEECQPPMEMHGESSLKQPTPFP